MKLGNYQFVPEAKTIVIAILFIFILSSLGMWQVSRRSEKLGIEKKINDHNAAAVIDLNKDKLDVGKGLKYRKVKVTGVLSDKGITFIDNIRHGGKYGFYVYSPLKLDNSEKHILINHGWIPYQGSREDLPEVKLLEGVQAIEGTIQIPSKRPFVESSIDELDIEGKNLWLYMDVDKYASEAPFEIFPFVIYQAPDKEAKYIRDWPVFNAKVAMHTGYAIMWFSLAFIVFCIFIYSSFRKQDGDIS